MKTPWRYPHMLVQNQELIYLLEQKSKGDETPFRVIDLRERSEYDAGHIEGAVHFDWAQIINKNTGELNMPSPAKFAHMMSALGVTDDMRIILYDNQHYRRSALLWCLFDSYIADAEETVGLLNGNLKYWAGPLKKRLVTREPEIIRSRFKSEPKELGRSREITTGVLKHDLQAGTVRLLDARPKNEYYGRATRPPVEQKGRIPGAQYLPRSIGIADEIDGMENSTDLRETLRKTFNIDNNALSKNKKSFVVYAHSGIDSAWLVFILHAVGIDDVKWYRKGWIDWVRSGNDIE